MFLSAGNITNLFIQATIYILLGMAEIWLLLMGDIDLSIGYSAGIGGCLAVVLTNTVHHWSFAIALPLSILACTLISTLWGVICVYLRLPHSSSPWRARSGARTAFVHHRRPGRYRGDHCRCRRRSSTTS